MPRPFSGVRARGKTAAGDAIRREVTEFSECKAWARQRNDGWKYQDGSGGRPIQQYCYYGISIRSFTMTVQIATNRIRLPNIVNGVVPDLEGALAKCQWWQG